MGVATGVGILVAQRYGAKDREQLSVVIGNCITLSAIVSVITMIIGALITRPMLELLSTPASIIDWCADYLMIYFLGIAGFAYYNILSGVLRGMGDSLSALGFLLVAAALNVGLDLWFVAGLGMGVAGVALATVLAQTISAFLTALILLFGRQLMGVFTETAVLVDLSMRMMQILAFGYIAMSITQCLSGVMRGAGDTMTPMWISIITTVVLRVPIAYGIAFFTRSAEYPTGRPESPFISLLVSWSLGALLTAVAYRFGAWRKRLATAEPAPQL